MGNVVAVIVTYNRLSLLQEAVASVKAQTVQPLKIVIINNGCTDGTAEWLQKQKDLKVITHSVNSGASGGFHSGIKKAVSYHTEWIWIMDDDTICDVKALEGLLQNTSKIDGPIGFVGSRCNWRNGEPHSMNIPEIKPRFNKTLPFNKYDEFNLLLIESNSWVSMLINTEAAKAVGLPYKEFFFWSDDLEYTQRITKAGYLGFYCMNSTVLHKTAANYFPDFYNETINNVWKHKYGFRNEFFMVKKNKGFLYFCFWLVAKVGYTSFKLFKIRKDNRFKFISVLFYAAWKSIFFNPKIDQL